MEPFGEFKKGILNVGEAPGQTEDARGKQWQGKVGSLLNRTYRELGINLFEDCLNINAINCRPTDKKGNNRPPTSSEIACCRSRVLDVIKEYKPKVIVALGGSALTSLLGHRWKKDLGGITKWHSWQIPDKELNVWVCPTFHPSFIERSRDNKAVEVIWKQDLKQAIDKVETPLPPLSEDKYYVQIITNTLSLLDTINDNTTVAIDFETTGIKPHAEGHKIICASVAFSSSNVYSFMLPDDKAKLAPFIRLLKNKKIKKIIQNAKFEIMWAKVQLGTNIENIVWDTMIASHLLDNRKGITGLKFQIYVNFGVMNYEETVTPFLTGNKKKGSNTINRIFDLIKTTQGKTDLLTYCGLDSLYTYRLAELQMEQKVKRTQNQ